MLLEPFTISTVASYNFNTVAATIVVKAFCCLIESCIGCSKFILEKYYGRAKFRRRPIIELHTAHAE